MEATNQLRRVAWPPARSAVSRAPGSDDTAVVVADRGGAVDAKRRLPAMAAIYERYSRLVHAALLARVPAADAEDLVQDVFVAAMRRLPTLRDRDALAGWLLTIARNRATDYWRRARKTSSEVPDRGADGPPRAEANQVLARIQSLPEAYREPLVLRLVEGMTGPEIAARTGLSPDSVRVNLHRGMKLLREALATEDV